MLNNISNTILIITIFITTYYYLLLLLLLFYYKLLLLFKKNLNIMRAVVCILILIFNVPIYRYSFII